MLKNRNHDRMKQEAVRYLGYGKNAVDEQTSALIDRAFSELKSAANPKFVYRIFDLSCVEEERICFGNIRNQKQKSGEKSKRVQTCCSIWGDTWNRRGSIDDEKGCNKYGGNCGAAGMCSGTAGRVL